MTRSIEPLAAGMAALALALAVAAAPVSPARAADQDVEMGFMPSTETVTLLNEGGKYVAIDLKHIDQGQSCRMDADAVIMKVGPGAAPGTMRVRSLNPQLHSGGCPFLTEFEIPDAQYAAARHSFEDRKDATERRFAEIRKEIGDKWDELIGGK